MKAEEIIADLYSKTGEKNVYGIDVSDGKVKDVAEIGILDCWETKSWAIKLCVDAVLTILKVNLKGLDLPNARYLSTKEFTE